MASRPNSIANPNELFDWIETVIDSGGGVRSFGEVTDDVVDNSTVDGTYGSQEAAVIQDLVVLVNEILAALIAAGIVTVAA